MEPLVSIIIPVFNAEKFLAQTLDSVLHQTYSNWEMLLVDDYSKDGSAAIIKEYQQRDHRIKLFTHQSNQGLTSARNTAIYIAQGEYIAFIDSDDIWDKEKLAIQIEFMIHHKILFSHTAYRLINKNCEVIGNFFPPKKVNYNSLLKTNVIGCLTAIWHVQLLKKMGQPILNSIPLADYVLWLKFLKQVDYAYLVVDKKIPCLASYRVHQAAMSHNKWKVAKNQWRVYREVEKLNVLTSCYYFIQYAWYGIKKRWIARIIHKLLYK